MQRRHRDRLQCATKRRSTATCSSREMDGIALESVLQNFLTNRASRRRLGRPSSSNGSPTSSSPKNGSLSEITSQENLPTLNQKRVKEIGRKEWNSASELTETSSQKKVQSNSEENNAKAGIPHEEEMKPSKEEEDFTQPVNRTTRISSSGRSFSATPDDGEEDVQDNNEVEAQKLREASKKVLRFQNSRSSVSSSDHSFENQKSPSARTKLPRQRTFDETTDSYPGDPTNEDLVNFLLNTQSSSKRNLGRRHTLPTKVPKTEEVKDDPWAHPPVRTPNSAAREKDILPAEGDGHSLSKQVFVFTNVSHKSPSAEEKNKPMVSLNHAPDEGLGEQNQDSKSVETTSSHVQKNNENIPPKSTWIKTETSGLFFSFLKRLGDLGKPNSKETVNKGADSSA